MSAEPGEEQDRAWADFYTTCLIVTNKYCERAKQLLALNPTIETPHAQFRFFKRMQIEANAYARDRRTYVRTQGRDEQRVVTRLFNNTARMIWIGEGLDIDLFDVGLELRHLVIQYDGDPDEDNWEDISDDDGLGDEPESKACNSTMGPQTEGATKTTASDFREQQNISIPSASAYEQHANHSAPTNQRRQFLEISTQQQSTAASQDQQHNQTTVQGPHSGQQHQPSSVTVLQYPLKTQGPIVQQGQTQKTQASIVQQQYQKGQATVTKQPQFPVTELQHQRNQTIETQPLPQGTRTLTRGPYKQSHSTTTQQIPQLTEFSLTVQHQDLPAMCEHPEKAPPTVAQEGQQQPQTAPVIAAEQQSQKTQATITRELQPQKSQTNVIQQQNQKGAAVHSQQSPRAQATMGPHSQKIQAGGIPQQQPKGATVVTQTAQATGTVQQQQPKTTGTFVTQNTKSVGIPEQQQKDGATHTTVPQQQQPKTSLTQQHPAKGAQQQQKDKHTAIPQLPLSTATVAKLPHTQPKEGVLQQQKNLVIGTQRSSNSTTQQQGQYKPQQSATEKPQRAPGVTPQSQNPRTAAQQQQGARSPDGPTFQKPFDFKGLGISDEWLAIMDDGRDSEADAEYFRNMKGPSTQADGKGEGAAEDEEGIWDNADWGEWPEWWWEILSGEGKITKARYAEVLANLGYSFPMDRCWAEFEEEEK